MAPAISAVLACNPATSWYYDFTYPLSWSNKCEVAEVLSDIPFISVGILTFGISTLFLVIKRVSLSTGSLFFSALLAFVAAVLDLSQTLSNGSASSGHVTRASEVLFGFSVGLRFLFYWSYVAEPSIKDLSAVATGQRVQRIGSLFVQRTHEPHNGSWMRWGLPGEIVCAGLLFAIIVITTLQIAWRVLPQFHQYSNVYAADAALELLVSFLLLLKLLLNAVVLNSADNMVLHTFSECLAPIFGLLVNIAVALGNLLFFAFTESMVGRLLQALEAYIIVVFVMVTAFLKHRDVPLFNTSPQIKERTDGMFTLPEPARGSTFRITPPLIETPRMSTILGLATQNKELSREMMLHRSARRSLNRVSSWLSFRAARHRSRQEDEEVKLWHAKAKVDSPYMGDADTDQYASIVTQTSKERPELVRGAPPKHISILSALRVRSPSAMSKEDSVYSGRIQHASRTDLPQRTIPPQVWTGSIPIQSFLPPIPRTKHVENITISPEASPVYGLGGIQSLASTFDSRTSLDKLPRQRNELGQRVEAPGVLPAETIINPPHSDSILDGRNVGLTRSPSTGQRTVCSEVSLSNFPVPPGLTTLVPPLPPFSSSSIKRIRGDRRVRLAAAQPISALDRSASVPSQTPASLVDILGSPRFNSVPHTPTDEENEPLSAEVGKFPHVNSRETQYNVTSFIGGRVFCDSSTSYSVSDTFEDLATPGESCRGSQEKPWWPTENGESGSETKKLQVPSHTGQAISTVPQPFERASNTDLSSFASSSLLRQANIMHEPDNQTSRSLRIALSPENPVTSCVQEQSKDGPRPPGRPHLLREADQSTTASGERVDRAQRMFVRRRPPPLAIQSHTREHNAVTSRIQVLVDD